jgi:phage-related minor tail protein
MVSPTKHELFFFLQGIGVSQRPVSGFMDVPTSQDITGAPFTFAELTALAELTAVLAELTAVLAELTALAELTVALAELTVALVHVISWKSGDRGSIG